MTKDEIAKINPLDLPFESFKQRLSSGELATPQLNDLNRKLHRVSGYRAFIADVDESDCARPNLPRDERPAWICR